MPKVSKADLLTPANAVTITGVLLTAIGALSLDTPGGVSLAITGKFLDMVDGPVARRTHVSTFGARFDSIADKVTVLILIVAAFHFHLVPGLFLLFLLAYHVLVFAMAADAVRRGVEAHATQIGKYTMFLQITALLLSVVSNVSTAAYQFIHPATVIFIALSVVVGSVSFAYYVRGYVREVLKKPSKMNRAA
jgi:phosphatidylglycerophosphate synthase